ncbi:MAG: urate hydroxylase PuuD [Acidobacteria bacterium]|nr:urate hydroxylase PuuD [Acidobacteriota bacterium]
MMEIQALVLLLQVQILPPSDVGSNLQMLLRWIHFLAGITWIGLLYFFNLVNVPLMKALDAPTKGKVIPQLMPRALWWFRWGAVVTVLAGLIYYILILDAEPRMGRTLLIWAVLAVGAWALDYLLLRTLNNGWALAVATLIVVGLMGHLMVYLNTHEGASNRSLSIGVGGGIGMIMLLNVWGVIWPAQKRIIAWTKENAEKGTAIPPESAKLARRAFLASRTNFWLSIPMLFFMAAASHYPMFGA